MIRSPLPFRIDESLRAKPARSSARSAASHCWIADSIIIFAYLHAIRPILLASLLSLWCRSAFPHVKHVKHVKLHVKRPKGPETQQRRGFAAHVKHVKQLLVCVYVCVRAYGARVLHMLHILHKIEKTGLCGVKRYSERWRGRFTCFTCAEPASASANRGQDPSFAGPSGAIENAGNARARVRASGRLSKQLSSPAGVVRWQR